MEASLAFRANLSAAETGASALVRVFPYAGAPIVGRPCFRFETLLRAYSLPVLALAFLTCSMMPLRL